MKVAAVLGSELEEALRRVEYTLERVKPDVLILSCTEIARDMEKHARKLEYKGKIIIDENSASTYENAKNIREILERFPEKGEIYVCTSSYHVPSASLIFRSYLKGKPYSFKIVSLPTSLPTKSILRNSVIEVLSILQDLASIYLCKIYRREDVYENTLKKLKVFFTEKILVSFS